ncbi:hypothetical protein [Mycoplasma sp. E35C]|uniref:hypothetical protein n=1 Tax=Mycoplasma sp. E35C TaxID=2801918 RepID=UPI001CA40390|nr:hypothetical protein [Mycoplasma sp. E35C]QZX48905.1 hypothetical protein JJE79_02495 [Mycoplasma sp. E35C]
MSSDKKIKLSDHLWLENGETCPSPFFNYASYRYVKGAIPYPSQADVDKITRKISFNKYWLLPNVWKNIKTSKKGELVFFRYGDVGMVSELDLDFAYIDFRFFKIVFDKEISKEYIKNFFIYNKKTIERFRRGSVIKGFVINEFNDWLRTKEIPSLEFQIKPSLLFEKIENDILHNHLKLQKIEKLKNALIVKMFVSVANTHTHTHTHTHTDY